MTKTWFYTNKGPHFTGHHRANFQKKYKLKKELFLKTPVSTNVCFIFLKESFIQYTEWKLFKGWNIGEFLINGSKEWRLNVSAGCTRTPSRTTINKSSNLTWELFTRPRLPNLDKQVLEIYTYYKKQLQKVREYILSFAPQMDFNHFGSHQVTKDRQQYFLFLSYFS